MEWVLSGYIYIYIFQFFNPKIWCKSVITRREGGCVYSTAHTWKNALMAKTIVSEFWKRDFKSFSKYWQRISARISGMNDTCWLFILIYSWGISFRIPINLDVQHKTYKMSIKRFVGYDYFILKPIYCNAFIIWSDSDVKFSEGPT